MTVKWLWSRHRDRHRRTSKTASRKFGKFPWSCAFFSRVVERKYKRERGGADTEASDDDAYSEFSNTRINDANQADSIEGCGRGGTQKRARSTGRSRGDRYLPVAARPGISHGGRRHAEALPRHSRCRARSVRVSHILPGQSVVQWNPRAMRRCGSRHSSPRPWSTIGNGPMSRSRDQPRETTRWKLTETETVRYRPTQAAAAACYTKRYWIWHPADMCTTTQSTALRDANLRAIGWLQPKPECPPTPPPPLSPPLHAGIRRKVLVVIRLYSRRITQSQLTNRRERDWNGEGGVSEPIVNSRDINIDVAIGWSITNWHANFKVCIPRTNRGGRFRMTFECLWWYDKTSRYWDKCFFIAVRSL